MDICQFTVVATIVMICSSNNQLGPFKIVTDSIVEFKRLIVLVCYIVVIVIMVEDIYLGCKTTSLELGSQSLYERSFFLPWHI